MEIYKRKNTNLYNKISCLGSDLLIQYVTLHENGNVYQKGFYKNGHQVGKWYCYTTEGEPFKIYIYDKNGNWIKLKVWNSEKENGKNQDFIERENWLQ